MALTIRNWFRRRVYAAASPFTCVPSISASKDEGSKSTPRKPTPNAAQQSQVKMVSPPPNDKSAIDDDTPARCTWPDQRQARTGAIMSAEHDILLWVLLTRQVRLETELAAARAQLAQAESRLEKQSFCEELERELEEAKRGNASRATLIDDLRGQLEVSVRRLEEEQRRNALETGSLKGQKEMLQRSLEDERREKAEQAARIERLQDDLGRVREASARRTEDSDRLEYVLASTGQVGSVARSVLASAPESVLYKTFCGEWDYARDKKGRALIACHPKRWAAVLEHLTTGAVPAERDPLLLEQARYWNLSRLVEGLEARNPCVVASIDPDSKGFKVRCTFVSVMSRLTTGEKRARFTFAAPPGRWWALQVSEEGTYLRSVMPPGGSVIKRLKLRFLKWRLLLRSEKIEKKTGSVEYPDEVEKGWGFHWDDCGYSFEQLVAEPLARMQDSLVVELETRFLDS